MVEAQKTCIGVGKRWSLRGIEPKAGCGVSVRSLLAYGVTQTLSSALYQTIWNAGRTNKKYFFL